MLKKTKSGIPIEDFKLASNEATVCGMGIDYKNGALYLPNFNPVSGDIDGFTALYIVNGAVETAPKAEFLTQRGVYCNNSAVSATGVTITGCLVGTSLVALATRQLTAVVSPSGAVQTGTWTTSDADIATVGVTGLVTAVAPGNVTITFTSTDGGFTATCAITVVGA